MIASRIFALLPLAILAVAGSRGGGHHGGHGGGGISQCNTGGVNCCNTVYNAEDFQKTTHFTELGMAADNLGSLIGVVCSPVIGGGTGAGCEVNQQPVCCTDNTFNGLINVGCSPINIYL